MVLATLSQYLEMGSVVQSQGLLNGLSADEVRFERFGDLLVLQRVPLL